MACKYWYNGKFRTEEEFKSILNNGLIDQLIRDGVVTFEEDFPTDESLIKESKEQIKIPIELSIQRKIQRGKNLNRQRKEVRDIDENGNPVVTSEPVKRNPSQVLEESRKKKPGKYNKQLTLLVATDKGLYINGNLLSKDPKEAPKKGSVGYNVLQDLQASMSADQYSALLNLDPSVVGSVFMIVDSANGAFPVKLFTNKIKDTELFKDVKEALRVLKDPKESEENKDKYRKALNRITYMYDVSFKDGKYIVERVVKNRTTGEAKTVKIAFEKNEKGEYVAEVKDPSGATKTQTILDYVGDSVYRVDYTKINTGTYNTTLAKNKVITTDLYSEDGNFFHSSNIVLAYSVVNAKADAAIKENLQKKLGSSSKKNGESVNKSSKESQVPNPNSNSKSKPDEAGGIFNLSADKLINSDLFSAVRYVTLPEKKDKDGKVLYKKKTFRVLGRLGPTGFFEVTERQLVNLNTDGTYTVVSKFPLTEAQIKTIDKAFLNDKLVKQKTAEINKQAVETEMDAMGIDPESVQDLDSLVDETQKSGQLESEDGASNELDDLDVDSIEGNEVGDNDIREQRIEKENIPTPEKKLDKKTELARLKKILGKAFIRKSGKDGTVRIFKNFETLKHYLPAKTYKMLLEANKNGSELFGLFTTAAVLIKHNAPAGVAFHEAFHVVFNLALPIEERIKIVNEAYTKYPELKTKVLESGKELTWLQLEEFLADQFMDYANNNEKFTGSQLDTRTGQEKTKDILAGKETFKEIPKFFKGLNRMLNVFFSQNPAINIDNLFEDINTGVYADKIEFKNTTLDTSVRQMSSTSSRVTSPHRKFTNPLELEAALQTLNNVFFDAIDIYRRANGLEDASISDSYVINEIGVDKLMSTVLTNIIGLRKNFKQNNNTLVSTAYSTLLNVLTNDNKALARNKEGKILVVNGQVQFSKSTPLIESFLSDLRSRYNINITFGEESAVVTDDLTDGPQFGEDSDLDAFLKDEVSSDRVAIQNSIEVNPKETQSQVLKRYLNRIPKKHRTEDGKEGLIYNIHNQPIYEDGNKLFGTLVSRISDSYNFDAMVSKLEKINKSWSKKILEDIKSKDKDDFSNIGRDLWLAIGNKTFVYYSTVIKENGVYRRMGTNRNTLDNIIKDKIIAEFLNPDNKLFKIEGGKNWKENINKENAIEFFTRINDTRKVLKNIIARSKNTNEKVAEAALETFNLIQENKLDELGTADTVEKKKRLEDLSLLNFNNLSKLLSEFNIILSPQEVEAIYNPNLKNPINSLNKLDNFLSVVQNIAKSFSGAVASVTRGENRKIETTYRFTAEPRNPFLVKEVEEGSKGDNDLLKALAAAIEPALSAQGLFSFTNMDGKAIYALVYAGQIHKMMSQIKDPEQLQNILDQTPLDNFTRNLPFVKELLDPDSNLSNQINLTLLDGMREERKSKGVVYSRMSDQELFATQIGMFINNQTKIPSEGFRLTGNGFFKLGIASDSPNVHFMSAPRLTREVIIDKLVETARAEHQRILKVQNIEEEFANSEEGAEQNELLRIPSYIKNGKKWHTLSFLNNSEVGIATMTNGFNETGIRKAIEEFLTEDITKEGGFFNREIAELKRKGIVKNVTDNGNILFTPDIIDTRITNNRNVNNTQFLKDYLLNQFYYSTQTNTLFAGDGAFYKSTVEAQKRFKQLFSPGTYTLLEGDMDAIILDDIEEFSSKSLSDAIVTQIDSSNLTEGEKRLTKEIWKGKHNITDAATVLSLRRKKEILESLQRWTPEMEESLKRIEKQEDTLEDFYTLNKNPFAAPTKQFTYTVRNINGVRVPLQIKNAEFVPTPAFALQKEGGTYKYPKLAALYLDLNGGTNLKGETVTPKADLAIFESAIKVGAVANKVSINKDGGYEYKFNSYEEVDGEFALKDFDPAKNTIKVSKADYRLQQETPPHFEDDRSNFGTQLRNLIIQDLDPDVDFDLGDGDIRDGEATAQLFQEIVANDLEREYNQIANDFLLPDGELNYDKILPILAEAARERGYGPSYLQAISPVKDENGNTKSYLPLYHPKISYQTQSLVNSIVRNRITKQKVSGGQLVNFSSFGVSDKLEMKIENGGIVLEAIMPWTSRKYFPTNEEGEIDIEQLKSTPEGRDLLEIVANRIPTEDKYSMFKIRIVDFSPKSMGGQIILPREITTIAGLDFDIDKVFFMMKNFYYKDGKIRLEKFIDKVETEEEIDQLAGNIYRSLPAYKRFLDAVGIKGSLRAKKIENYKKEFRESTRKQQTSPQRVKAVDSLLKALTQEEEFEFAIDEQFYSEAQNKELDNIKRFLSSQSAVAIRKLNSKKASDNKKINIIKGILGNASVTPYILQTGNFETLKAYAAKIRLLQAGRIEEAKLKGRELIAAAEKLDEDNDFNINYPSTQLELFRRNMDGRDLTGIFANHTSHHAKAQHTNLRLKSPITINQKSYQALNKSIVNGQRVSRVLAVKDAAVVDNAKDPLAGFLNINYFTADVVALSDRLGVPEGFTYALINQPTILELTRDFFNDPGTFNPGGMIYETIGNIKERLRKGSGLKNEEINNLVKKILEKDLNTKLLEKHLKEPEVQDTEFQLVQLAALTLFDQLYNIGEELSTGVQAARVDTQSLKPSNSENFTIVQKQKKVFDKETDPEKINYISGLSEVFIPGRSSTQIMIPSFNEFGILKPISEILEKMVPSIGNYIESEARFNYSYLGDLKQEITDQLKASGLISEKHARLIDTQFINYIATSFPFFDASQSKDIVTKTPDKLRKIRQQLRNPNSKLSKELGSNVEGIPYGKVYLRFLEELEIKSKEKNIPLEKRIVYYVTGKDSADFFTSETVWEEMLNSSNDEIRNLALDLVKYSFFTNGYGYGPYSIASLIPPSFWGDEYQSKLNPKGITFNQHIEGIFAELKELYKQPGGKQLAQRAINEGRFIDQFVRAFGKTPGLVKLTTAKPFSAEKRRAKGLTRESDVREFVRESDSGRALNLEGNLLVDTLTNADFSGEMGPLMYVKRYVKGKKDLITGNTKGSYQLYKLTDIEPLTESRKILIYSPISFTSLQHFGLVLDQNNDIETSWLEQKKETSSLEKTLSNNTTSSSIKKEIKEKEKRDGNTPTTVELKGEVKKEEGGLFDSGPQDPYNYTYRTEIEGIGISEEDWNKMTKKEKQYHLDCNGI